MNADRTLEVNFLRVFGFEYLDNLLDNLGLLLFPYGMVNLQQLAQEKSVIAATLKHRLEMEREAGRREGFDMALGREQQHHRL